MTEEEYYKGVIKECLKILNENVCDNDIYRFSCLPYEYFFGNDEHGTTRSMTFRKTKDGWKHD